MSRRLVVVASVATALVGALVASTAGPVAASTVTRLTTDRSVDLVAAVVDGSGHRHVIYDDTGRLIYLTDASGSWARTVIGPSVPYIRAGIATTPAGDVLIAYVQPRSDRSILVVAWHRSGAWTTTTVADPFSGCCEVAIASASGGIAHVAWPAEDGMWHGRSTAGGTWQTERISTDAGSSPSIAIGPGGHAQIAWVDTEVGAGAVRIATDAAGSWKTTTIASGDLWSPVVAVGGDGVRHLLYDRSDGSPGLYYATDASGSWVSTRLAAPDTGHAIDLTTDGPSVAWGPATGGIRVMRRSGAGWGPPIAVASGKGVFDVSVGHLPDGRVVVTHREAGRAGDPTFVSDEPGVHSTIETSGGWPDTLIERQLGVSSAPSLAAAPDGTLRMTYARCGAGPSMDGVLSGVRTGGTWTWTRISPGCADASALAIDQDGASHVAWLASGGMARYTTDAGGTWMTTDLPATIDEPDDRRIAITIDPTGVPVVIVSGILRDAGSAVPEAWTWRPGDPAMTAALAVEHPSLAFAGDGHPIIGGYSWLYDVDYLWRRPAAGVDDPATHPWLAPAGRWATVTSTSDGRVAAAFSALGAPIAYVATGVDFPDALAAAAVAAREDGPVVLTKRDSLPPAADRVLAALTPDRVVTVGGPAAVSDTVEHRVAGHAYSDGRDARVGGRDRYETAALLGSADGGYDCCSTYVIASGETYADALAGTVMAGRAGGALLLVTHDSVPAPTASRIGPTSHVIILGGTGAVSASVESRLRRLASHGSVDRLAGADRYATAAVIAKEMFPTHAPVVFLASGEDFPDGLAAGPAAAHDGGPVLLTRRDSLPSSTRSGLGALAPARVVIVGGTGAVSPAVQAAVAAALPHARVDRVAGATRYETAAAISQDAWPRPAGLYAQDIPSTSARRVSALIPSGPIGLASAADGSARIVFPGPSGSAGLHLASDASGTWTVSPVTHDARDREPSVVVVGGTTWVAFLRHGDPGPSDGIFLASG